MSNPLAVACGRALRRMRKARGVAQEQVAQAAGIERQNYARLEQGKHTPSLQTLLFIAGAFGMRLWELVREIERERAEG